MEGVRRGLDVCGVSGTELCIISLSLRSLEEKDDE
jgi:hypothetical protein